MQHRLIGFGPVSAVLAGGGIKRHPNSRQMIATYPMQPVSLVLMPVDIHIVFCAFDNEVGQNQH